MLTNNICVFHDTSLEDMTVWNTKDTAADVIVVTQPDDGSDDQNGDSGNP